MVVVGLFGAFIVPVPWNLVQVPSAEPIGVLPTIVTDVVGVHTCWSGPALAGVAVLS